MKKLLPFLVFAGCEIVVTALTFLTIFFIGWSIDFVSWSAREWTVVRCGLVVAYIATAPLCVIYAKSFRK